MFCCEDYSIGLKRRQRAKTPSRLSGYSSDLQGIRWVMPRVLWVILSVALLAWGCDKPASTAPRPPDKIKMVATAYPLADLARQVGGSLVQCDWVAEQGQSLDA